MTINTKLQRKYVVIFLLIIYSCCATCAAAQSFTVCESSGATNIDTFLTVADLHSGDTETWTVIVPPAHGTLSGFPYSVFSAGIATLTPTGLTYTPATGYSGTDSFIIRITDSTDTTIIALTVTIDAPPVSGTIYGSTSVCAGATITLNETVAGGIWSSSHTTIATVDSVGTSGTGVVTGITSGTDSVLYSVSNSCGVAMQSVVVTINPLPVAGIISGIFTLCAGSNVSLSDSASGGIWSETNINAIVTSRGIVYGNMAGMDTIMYMVTNSCGTLSANAVVTVVTLPDVGVISGPSSVCVGSNITLMDSVAGGTWSASNGNATVSGGIVSGYTSGTDSIVYANTNSCGSSMTSFTVTINPLPNADSITGASAVCAGGIITLIDTATGGVWTITNGDALLIGPGIVESSFGGIDTINYAVSNGCGTVTATKAITIDTSPYAGTITGTSSIVCLGSPITLTDTTTGGSWGEMSGNTLVSGGVVTGVNIGTDNIYYIVNNSCGTAIATYMVTVSGLPIACPEIGGPTIFCVGLSTTIGIVCWSDSDDMWETTNGTASVSSGGVIVGIAAGIDTILDIANNSCGSDTGRQVVTVLPDIPNVVRSGDTLTATAGYSTYQWYDNSIAIPVAIFNYLIITDTGNYYVTASVVYSPSQNNYSTICSGTSDIITVTNLAVTFVDNQADINIYPNPAQNTIIISSPQIISKVAIINLVGQTVCSKNNNDLQVEISIANLPPGVYLVKVNDTNVYRLVKE